jgi:hypothetical protein
MPVHMDKARPALFFHFCNDQGDYRKIESSGWGIEMNDQRWVYAMELEGDFVFGQITLNGFKLFHNGILKISIEKQKTEPFKRLYAFIL